MKSKLPASVMKRKEYVKAMIANKVLATGRNFLPLTYDMKESLFGRIVGVKPMFVYMPIDTSHMSVLSILEAEEKIIQAKKAGSLKVVSEEDKNEMMEATTALNLLLYEDNVLDTLSTDKEKIEYLLTRYPELNNWLQE